MLVEFDYAVTQMAYIKAAMDEIPAFRPDNSTPATVQALVDGAAPVRAAYVAKKEAITGARALRHTTIDALHEACVDFAAQGKSRFRKNPTVSERFLRLPVRDETFQQTITRGTASEALWAVLPQVGTPPAAFTVGQGNSTLSLAGFTALITAARTADAAIPPTDQDFQSAEADLHAKQSELEDFVTAALEQGRSQFSPGTPQREIIDAIPHVSSGGGSGPAAPQPPGNVTLAQENPGDAVVANADAVSGATLYRIYARLVGDTNPPTVVASSATLPTSFTIAPGEYEFTMTAEDPAGESEPSAPPVVLTVG